MKIARLLPSFIYLITLPLLLIDSVGSSDKIYKYFHLHSYDLALMAIILLLLLRIFGQQTVLPMLGKINVFVTTPITLICAVLLTIWDFVSPPNTVFALTHLQETQLFLIGLFGSVVILVNQTNDWFGRNTRMLIFSGAFFYLAAAYITSLFPFDIFIKLSHEDKLIENTQVVVLLLALWWASKSIKLFFKKGYSLHAIIFLIICLGLLFIAGDEISWGQRIFHLATPQTIGVYNTQDEITVHNLKPLHNLVNFGYMIIGLYGAAAWTLLLFFPKLQKKKLALFIPPWYCAVYYYVGFFYNFLGRINPQQFLNVWSESAELLLYSGMMFTTFMVYKKIKNNI